MGAILQDVLKYVLCKLAGAHNTTWLEKQREAVSMVTRKVAATYAERTCDENSTQRLCATGFRKGGVINAAKKAHIVRQWKVSATLKVAGVSKECSNGKAFVVRSAAPLLEANIAREVHVYETRCAGPAHGLNRTGCRARRT